MENENTHSKVIKSREAIREIASMCRQMGSDLSIGDVLDLSNKTIWKIIAPDLSEVYLVNGEMLVGKGEFPKNEKFRQSAPELKRVGECLCGLAAESGHPLFSMDIRKDMRCTLGQCKMAGLKSGASIPLMSRDKAIGVLMVGSHRARDFEKDAEILELIASQLAFSLKNALLNKAAEENKANFTRYARQIKNAKDLLQDVFDGIPQSLMLFDKNKTVLRINKAAAEYFGVTFKDMIGKKCGSEIPKNTEPCKNCNVLNYLNTDTEISFEQHSCMDPERALRVFIYPISGNKEQRLVRFLDVTEQKMFEERMILHEKLSAVGLLASGITHEIKNPIGLLTGNIPVLKAYSDEMIETIRGLDENAELMGMTLSRFREDISQVLEIMEYGAEKINQTVSLIQDFNRPARLFEKTWVDPKEVANRVTLMCRTQIRKKVRTFELKVAENIGPFFMESEVLESLMTNLLVNAIQAVEKNDSRVTLSLYPDPTNSESLVLEVGDNGVGIGEGDIGKIFGPFYTTKDKGVGTGLGLYICKKIVEELNGEIKVQSRPGEGATFRVVLPVTKRNPKKRPEDAHA